MCIIIIIIVINVTYQNIHINLNLCWEIFYFHLFLFWRRFPTLTLVNLLWLESREIRRNALNNSISENVIWQPSFHTKDTSAIQLWFLNDSLFLMNCQWNSKCLEWVRYLKVIQMRWAGHMLVYEIPEKNHFILPVKYVFSFDFSDNVYERTVLLNCTLSTFCISTLSPIQFIFSHRLFLLWIISFYLPATSLLNPLLVLFLK